MTVEKVKLPIPVTGCNGTMGLMTMVVSTTVVVTVLITFHETNRLGIKPGI